MRIFRKLQLPSMLSDKPVQLFTAAACNIQADKNFLFTDLTHVAHLEKTYLTLFFFSYAMPIVIKNFKLSIHSKRTEMGHTRL